MHALDLDLDSEIELTPVVPTSTSLAPGQHATGAFEPLDALERYKLVARLGHGGMAEVFLAAWEVMPFVHRPVVIKRLHAQFGDDARLMQMFLDEARLVCQLQHKNIVKTLEAGAIDGRCCIAMEYLEGQPLHRLVRRAYERGRLPLEHGVSIAIAVLDALHYAHEARDSRGRALGIVHRDVSPHNIFVCNDGSVKVLDFGIAKAATQEGHTATGIIKGKVGYIAPEQAVAEAVDRRADVWSVGVVLWESLTGARLFKGETDAATLNLTLRGEIPSAGQRRPELPGELEIVLGRALQRSAATRYPDAAAMRDQLAHWLALQPAPAASLGALMSELFAEEIIEQHRLVSVLMARSDCTPPSLSPASVGAPSSTSALIVSNASSISSDELHTVHSRVDELTRRHRVVTRSLIATLLFVLGASGGFAYVAAARVHLFVSPASAAATPPTPAPAAPLAAPPPTSLATAASAAAEDAPRPTRTVSAAAPHAVGRPQPASAPAARDRRDASAPSDPAPRDVAAAPGFLTIDTSPWSMVSVAGRSLGQTPLVGVRLPPGPQTLSLRNPELGIETSYTLTIEPGKTLVRRIGIE